MFTAGVRALGPSRYPSISAVITAELDRTSPAFTFIAWRKAARPDEDSTYQVAFDQAARSYRPGDEPKGLNAWRDHMRDVALSIAAWADEAEYWRGEPLARIEDLNQAAAAVRLAMRRANAAATEVTGS